jgi:hypothetical protein
VVCAAHPQKNVMSSIPDGKVAKIGNHQRRSIFFGYIKIPMVIGKLHFDKPR